MFKVEDVASYRKLFGLPEIESTGNEDLDNLAREAQAVLHLTLYEICVIKNPTSEQEKIQKNFQKICSGFLLQIKPEWYLGKAEPSQTISALVELIELSK